MKLFGNCAFYDEMYLKAYNLKHLVIECVTNLTLNFPTIRDSSSNISSACFPRYNSNVWSHSENPSNSGCASNSFGYTFIKATDDFVFFLLSCGLNLCAALLAAWNPLFNPTFFFPLLPFKSESRSESGLISSSSIPFFSRFSPLARRPSYTEYILADIFTFYIHGDWIPCQFSLHIFTKITH